MPFEIEMLAVGNADAIILRYINEENKEFVVLIDAGNRKDGEKVVEHIKKWTKNKYIDLAVCTHPDGDHIGGFYHVLNNIQIKEFWIHDPGQHVSDLRSTRNVIRSDKSLEKSLKYVVETLDNSLDIISLIDSKKTIIRQEPFEGLKYPYVPLKVIGPFKGYYVSLLNRFRNVELLFEEEDMLEKSHNGGEILSEALDSRQILDKDNDKSHENNSSAILLFEPDNFKYLFTSDAGPEALNKTKDLHDLTNLDWLDVPHHGSRYNLTTDLIRSFRPEVAYVSCNGSAGNPDPAVIKELKRVGTKVFSTQDGYNIRRQVEMGPRSGYSDAVPL